MLLGQRLQTLLQADRLAPAAAATSCLTDCTRAQPGRPTQLAGEAAHCRCMMKLLLRKVPESVTTHIL